MKELTEKYAIDTELTDVAISPGKLPLIKRTKANYLAITRYFDRASPEGDTTINKLTNRVCNYSFSPVDISC
jgi:Mg2+ and Co2+ transporter CorA